MALLLKRLYESYFYAFNDLADPRADEYFLLRSPIPSVIILFLWYKFVFQWGPEYMKNRPPFQLKRIMMIYNIMQVAVNMYIVYYVFAAMHVINWKCTPVDYSDSYWGRKFLSLSHVYYLLKIADLLDTVFFVLRKKSRHISFLHTYHHFGMVMAAWIGCKFLGGGHSYFLGLANCIVHSLLYSYYLLTAYDSKYAQIIWLKKTITQAQMIQFVFLLFIFTRVLFVPDCNYPKGVLFVFIPQNLFMLVLFGDFYVRTYILEPRKKKRLEEEAKKMEREQQVEHKNET